MSWDVYLYRKEREERDSDINVGNYTSNCAQMFASAISGVTNRRPNIREFSDLSGLKTQDAFTILADVINIMIKNPDYFEKMNPENGWGSYRTYLNFLIDFLLACAHNPDWTVDIC
jgi:hypothetical protein